MHLGRGRSRFLLCGLVYGVLAWGVSPAEVQAQCGFSVTYQIGGALPAPRTCVIRAAGAVMNYTASSSAGWASISPSRGTVAPNATANLTIGLNPAGLGTGSRTTTISISAPGYAPLTFSVQLDIIPGSGGSGGGGGGGGSGGGTGTILGCTLAFSYVIGGALPAARGCTLTAQGTAFVYTTSSLPSWVSVSPQSATVSANSSLTVTVGVSPVGLSQGTYSTNVVLTAPSYAPATIAVSLTVAPPPPSQMQLRCTNVPASFRIGMPQPPPIRCDVTASGPALAFTASASQPWLVFEPPTGTIAGSTTGAFQAWIDTLALRAGTATNTITVSAPGYQSASTTVSFTVLPEAVLRITTPLLAFDYSTDSPGPGQQCLTVTSTAAVPFTATPSASWAVTTSSSPNTPSVVCVTPNPAELLPGFASTTIAIESPEASNGPLQVVVLVTIQRPRIKISESKLRFDYEKGSGAPLSKIVTVSRANSGPALSVSAAVNKADTWVSAAPAEGGSAGRFRIAVDGESTPVGFWQSRIEFSAPGAENSPLVLPVTLTIRNRAKLVVQPSGLSFSQTYRSPRSQQRVTVAGSATDFTVAISTESGGNWLSSTKTSGRTATDLDIAVDATGVPEGRHRGLLRFDPTGRSGESITVPVVLTVSNGTVLTASPASFNFKETAGAAQVVSDGVSVFAGGTLVRVNATTTGSAWLSLTTAGTLAGSIDNATGQILNTPGRVQFSVNATGLRAGIYSDVILLAPEDRPTERVSVPITLSVQAPNLIVPHLAVGDGWSTEISITNPWGEPAPFTLRTFGADGQPLAVAWENAGNVTAVTDIVPARGVRNLRSSGSALRTGWALIESTKGLAGNAFVRRTFDRGSSSAAMTLAPAGTASVVIPLSRENQVRTGVALTNPGLASINIGLTVRDENGRTFVDDKVRVEPRGQSVFFLDERYAELPLAGTVTLSAAAEFSAVGLRMNAEGFISSLDVRLAPATGPFAVPQVLDGGGWRTLLFVANTDTEPAPFAVTFRSGDGMNLRFPISGAGPSQEYADTIPVGGVRLIESEGAEGNGIVAGWAEVLSSRRVIATATYVQAAGSTTLEGSAAGGWPSRRLTMPFDNTGDRTAIAILNPRQDSPATVTITFRDEQGAVISASDLTLQSRARDTFFVSDVFPATKGRRGLMEVSGSEVILTGLQFTSTGGFAAVVPAASVTP